MIAERDVAVLVIVHGKGLGSSPVQKSGDALDGPFF
jgi:hypothetical protein